MGRLFNPGHVARDEADAPAAGGTATFYTTGTTTKKDTFSDAALAVANSNPITLDSDGTFPGEVFGSGSYTVLFKDVNGATLPGSEDDVRDFATDITYNQGGTGAGDRTQKEYNQDRVSVKDFAATGDGSTDDTVAIQAALDHINNSVSNAGHLHFPAGTYLVTSKLTITQGDNTKGFILSGEKRTKISSTVVGDSTLEIIDGSFVTIKDMWLDGNGLTGASGNGHAISFKDSLPGSGTFFPQHITINNVRITEFSGNDTDEDTTAMVAAGIYIGNGINIQIDNPKIDDCGFGIYYDKCQNSGVLDGTITNCDYDGIFLDTVADTCNIIEVDFVRCGQTSPYTRTLGSDTVPLAGLAIQAADTVVNVSECKFKGSVTQIMSWLTANLVVDGCHIRPTDKAAGNGDSAVWCARAESVNIKNNHLLGVVSGSRTYTFIEVDKLNNLGNLVVNVSGNMVDPADTTDEFLLVDGNAAANAVTLNVTGNMFGSDDRSGNPIITDYLKLTNGTYSGEVSGNTFIAGTGATITDCIDVGTGFTNGGLAIERNVDRVYDTGTITNPSSDHVGWNAEAVTGTNVITAAETGKTFYLAAAGGFVSTLPPPALGLKYTFIVKTALSGGACTVVTTSGDNIMNVLLLDVVGELVYATARDVITFTDGTLVGAILEVWSDGTSWHCKAFAGADGDITTGAT